MKKKVKFMCTAFRDGFQSVYGARVFTRDFLPAVEAARAAGVEWFEAGGGARFQSLYFYCNEDAFDMMDSFRAKAGPDADLQTLSRGINVVGLDSQPSDIIRLHAKLFKKHGITTIRNFDALNDVENLVSSGHAISEAGVRHQICVTLMELPPSCVGAHDADFYEATLRRILDAEIPYDSVCFKDASGTAVPSKVFETIRRARKLLPAGTFIHFHTHETAGIGVIANKAALDAGADAIDLSLAPCSGGTCQPDLIVQWHSLRGTEYELDIDIDAVREAEEVFKDCMKDYFLPPEALAVDPMIPWSPMPGGALTANTQMLRDHGILERYPEMIRAMSEVVAKGGFGTSVTPVSQFYFQQAFNNVLFGPWKRIADGYGRMVLGYFGRTPVAPDADVVRIAAEQLGLEPTTRSPLEMNDADPKKGTAAARRQLEAAGLPSTDENIFIAATCKEKGIAFLQGKGEIGVRKSQPAPVSKSDSSPPSERSVAASRFVVAIAGREYAIAIDGDRVQVDGETYEVSIRDDDGSTSKDSAASRIASQAASPASSSGQPIVSEMPGKVVHLACAPGSRVASGQPIVVIEAMKMEVKISSPTAGVIMRFDVRLGDQVQTGQTLAWLASN
jgi:pyruvate carboxylase subunit B